MEVKSGEDKHMKKSILLFLLTTTAVATFGLLVFSVSHERQPGAEISTQFFMGSDSASPAFVLAADAHGAGGRGDSLRNEVYRRNLGVNPNYGTNKYYGPYYDQTGGYYGSIGQQCAWNGWVYFCGYNSESFY
jgi:hypothetical protein